MWNKTNGFFSTVCLYYLMVFSVVIAIETTMIITQLHTLENLKLTSQTIVASNNLMAQLRCSVWNHESAGYFSDSNATLEFETDFDQENGEAILCAVGCTTFTYSFDFENTPDFQIRLND